MGSTPIASCIDVCRHACESRHPRFRFTKMVIRDVDPSLRWGDNYSCNKLYSFIRLKIGSGTRQMTVMIQRQNHGR